MDDYYAYKVTTSNTSGGGGDGCLGHYRHFKGNEYEVIGIARHSETTEPMVIYRALYDEGALWCRPAAMWNETIERDGKEFQRFKK